MIRSILSIFAGFFLIFIWVSTTHSIIWWIGGAEFAHREGTRIETIPWIVISLILWTIGGLIGGFSSALIAKHPMNLPPKVLALLVFAISTYNGLMYVRSGPPAVPEGIDPSSFQYSQFGIQPEWYPFGLAVLVAAGVIAGSWLHGTDFDHERPERPDGEGDR